MMKSTGSFLKQLMIPFAVAAIVFSCKKDNVGTYKYLESNSLEIEYSAASINYLLDAATDIYPEIADIKPYVSGNVDIYKITYKTTVNDKVISASGLVCVPTAKGEYPVLCFQNGTNTLNAYAPSEYVLNPVYQLIEIVASMGYIVVIPDYPGFGASADIPHPYLIVEPTVRSIVDMLYAVREMEPDILQGISVSRKLYLIGYSQGGWATLALHKAIELDYSQDFELGGSVCGAGPYDLNLLLEAMISVVSYPMPVYIGYIINAYSEYYQFTNNVNDIIKEPYASRLGTLYTGNLTSGEINSQLTTSVSDLFNADFLTGFDQDQKYASVRHALEVNSISAWNTSIPLYFIHGGSDSSVNPMTTETIYAGMIQAGTSARICRKEILPDLDHGDAVVPAMIRGLMFLKDLQ